MPCRGGAGAAGCGCARTEWLRIVRGARRCSNERPSDRHTVFLGTFFPVHKLLKEHVDSASGDVMGVAQMLAFRVTSHCMGSGHRGSGRLCGRGHRRGFPSRRRRQDNAWRLPDLPPFMPTQAVFGHCAAVIPPATPGHSSMRLPHGAVIWLHKLCAPRGGQQALAA